MKRRDLIVCLEAVMRAIDEAAYNETTTSQELYKAILYHVQRDDAGAVSVEHGCEQ